MSGNRVDSRSIPGRQQNACIIVTLTTTSSDSNNEQLLMTSMVNISKCMKARGNTICTNI